MSENTSKFQKNAELIFTYIYNNRIILISGFVLMIAVISGILIYNMNIENADKEIAANFEEALALYGMYQTSNISQDQLNNPALIVDITTRVQKTYNDAKGKKLKLRAAYTLGGLYFDVGNYNEAKKYYQEVANNRGFYLHAASSYNLANVLIELTNYSEATAALENFTKAYPKNYLTPKATLILSDLYRKQNDKTKAINVLKTWANNNTNNIEYLNTFNETITLIENGIY